MIKKIIAVLLMIAIAVGVILFFTKCGGSFGFGTGSGNEGSTVERGVDIEVSAEITETQSTEEATTIITEITEMVYADITISGSSYIYQNSDIALDELINKIKDLDITVRLTDDKASKKAYDDLVEALKANNIKYE